MLGLAGVLRMSVLTKEIQMCVNQAAPLNVLRRMSQVARSVRRTALGTPTPVESNVEDPSVLDRVSPTSTFGWRITPTHALRC